MTDEIVPKRGRGRPKGSLNRVKAIRQALPPEEIEALKRKLAGRYAEAVAAQALAADRKRRVKASIRDTFGSRGLQDVEAQIAAAEEQIVPPDLTVDADATLLRAS